MSFRDDRRLVIHIGLHKTGTTSIQQALQSWHRLLLEWGVHIPKTGSNRRRTGHHNIGRQLAGSDRFDPSDGDLAELETEIAAVNAPSVLLSSETLSLIDPTGDKYRKLADLATRTNRRLVIVGFVRSYVESINSLYADNVRKLRTGDDFQTFLNGCGGSWMWRYTEIFQPFERVARKTIVLRSSGDNLPSLFAALDFPPPPQAWPRFNTSVGPRIVEMCRVVHRKVQLGKLSNVSPKRLLQTAAQTGWNDGPSFWGFEPAEAMRKQAWFLDRDKSFLARYGIEFDPPAARRPNERTCSSMSDKERRQFLKATRRIVTGAMATAIAKAELP